MISLKVLFMYVRHIKHKQACINQATRTACVLKLSQILSSRTCMHKATVVFSQSCNSFDCPAKAA
jgi:hypothetical protein